MSPDDVKVITHGVKTPVGQHDRRFNAPTVGEVAILNHLRFKFVYILNLAGEAEPHAKVHRAVQGIGKGLDQQYLPHGFGESAGHRVAIATEGGHGANGSNLTALLGEGCWALRQGMFEERQDQVERK